MARAKHAARTAELGGASIGLRFASVGDPSDEPQAGAQWAELRRYERPLIAGRVGRLTRAKLVDRTLARGQLLPVLGSVGSSSSPNAKSGSLVSSKPIASAAPLARAAHGVHKQIVCPGQCTRQAAAFEQFTVPHFIALG